MKNHFYYAKISRFSVAEVHGNTQPTPQFLPLILSTYINYGNYDDPKAMLTAVNFLTEHLAYPDEDVKTYSALGLLTNGNEFINGLSCSLQSDYEASQAIIQQSKFPIPPVTLGKSVLIPNE